MAQLSIVLLHDVRAFIPVNPGGVLLAQTGKWFRSGDTITVGDPVTKTFDHRDQRVFPVKEVSREYFVLEVEVQNGSDFAPPAMESPYLTVSTA